MSKVQDGLECNHRFSEVIELKMRIWGAITSVALGVASLTGSVQASGISEFDLIYEVTISKLELAEVVLRASADYWAENPNQNSLNGHLSLRRILNESQNFRSVLAIENDGILAFDSFNPVPFLGAKDLSDRGYWQKASVQRPKEMVIGRAVTGRQSGLSFVPLAMAVPGGVGRRHRVVVLTALPERLLPAADVCSFCGVSLLSDGEVVASNRPLSEVNTSVLERLSFEGLYGAKTLSLRGMEVVAHWRRSEKYNLVMVYYEVEPLGE